ncbi:MAG TPA: histidinol-phosphate transaminase [Thermoanaerobaculia bacterium]|nr:histidinol-phosphate transaminase [Thermoanaerobaculia bacterium]
MTLSRRAFAQVLGAGAAAAALPFPRLVFAKTPTLSPVRLNANENPYGPSPAAIAAMRDALSLSSRYPDDEADALAADIAKLHGLSADEVLLGDGSSEILKLVAAAYTSPSRSVVIADPTFEAIGHYARATGAEVVKVPLDSSFAHDLGKMAPANVGVVYICNPNNPTASITPKAAMRAFLDTVPATTMVLVDEAYHHYATSSDYESVVPLVKSKPNLIVARTFSKIYGMAGLRAGYAVANRDVIKKLDAQKAWDSMNLMALVAARASLADSGFVAEGRRRNSATRAHVVESVGKMGYKVIPSDANFVMIDLRRDVKPVIAHMRSEGVRVGRLFPALPQHLRVTIGTPEEMQRFLEVMR